MSGNQFLLFIVHLKLNEHLLENLSVWEWNGKFRKRSQDWMVFHIIVLFYLFSSFSVSFSFLILFIVSRLSIIYLSHEIKVTNIFCLSSLVASCVLQDLSS